jgi:hypothetical protein
LTCLAPLSPAAPNDTPDAFLAEWCIKQYFNNDVKCTPTAGVLHRTRS